MAVFPCEYAPHRYLGAQRSMYLTRFAGSVVHTRKLRLCPTHFDCLAAEVGLALRLVDDNSTISMSCLVCGEPYDEGVSVRLYAGDGEPAVWAGEFCAAHAEAVGARLLWSTARPL